MELYNTYGKLANLHVVETKHFVLVANAELEDGNELADEVEGAEDEACADETVGTSRNRVGKLVAELNVVLVEPATRDDSIAVKMSYVVARRGVSISSGPI